MKDINYNYICTTIANLSGIPVRMYEGGRQAFCLSVVDLPADPLSPYLNEILSVNSHIGYFITPHFHYYGIVNSGQHKVVIGPSIQTRIQDSSLKELAFLCGLDEGQYDAFISGMKRIIPMPLDSILQIMCTINYIVNEEMLGIGDVAIYDAEQEKLTADLERERANSDFFKGANEFFESISIHNTLGIERKLAQFVKNGDISALRDWMDSIPAVRGGVLASDQLRQLKNIFIVTATLVSRAAIEGGMDSDEALSLSDAYIQKCELLNNMGEIISLQYHMVFDYTRKVEKLRSINISSRLILDTINYIRHHIAENVSAEDIAKAMFVSRTWLSHKFSRETGMTISDFVLKEKIEEAKRLLRYTDKSFVAISSYLGFSSQSHFSRTFRKYAGCLPSEYRKALAT